MAVDKPKLDPRLLELLYPDEVGELDEAELQARLDEAALSADDADDLRDLNSMLGLIRAEQVVEDVPASVHNSIMDAARLHHATSAAAPTPSRASAAAGRSPRVPEAERAHGKDGAKPFWARVTMNTGRQIALVATVLFVAGVAFVLMRGPQTESRYAEPNSSAYSNVVFEQGVANSPASEQAVPQKSVPQKPVPQKTELAQAESLNNEIASEEAADDLGSGETELAINSDFESEAKPEGLAAPEYRDRKSRSSQLRSSRSRKPAARSSARSPRPLAKKSKAAPSPQAKLAKADSAVEEEIGQKIAEETAPDTSKIDAIAESFASAHYDETTTRVDAFMQDPSASAQDKPRALEFKARAQEAGGNPSAALDTYERIRKNYSTFKSSLIAAAIARLDAQLNSKPMRRKRMNESSAPRPASMDMDSAQ